ncbi:MAG: PDZ domain-containing protein [Cytophagales bacterium]|nr:MAG: PDZ domain-containing protein [Cytophagales bacterium]TAF59790.1 MAG: PDZ domain-containing protein [Cytophagales bacterium]
MNLLKLPWGLLLFLALAFCSTSTEAQNIKRKPFLGAAFQKTDNFLSVTKVFEGSTAYKLGIQETDKILSINAIVFSQVQDVVAYIPTLSVGAPIEIKVLRDNKKLTLKGIVQPKLMETSPTGEVIYDEVPFKGGYLRSIVHKPKGEGTFPAVYYIQGYPCSSVDYASSPKNPSKQAIDHWVARGFVVYRVEKPGMGESTNTPSCETIDFETEIAAFEAGLLALQSYKFIKKEQIFLFGHSLGGLVAPVLSAKHDLGGVMVYGTLAVSWYEYLLDLHRYQSEFFGQDYEEIDNDVRNVYDFLYDWLVKRVPLNDMKANKDYEAIFNNPNNSIGFSNNQVIGRSFDFFPSVSAISYYKAWKNTKEPVLAMYGEHDIQALSPQGAETIARIINHYHPGNGTFLLLQDTEHLFLSVPDMATNAKMVADQSIFQTYWLENFNTQLTTQTVSWMNKVIAAQKP